MRTLALLGVLVGCARGKVADPPFETPDAVVTADPDAPVVPDPDAAVPDAAEPDAPPDAPHVSQPPPTGVVSSELCKLLSNHNDHDPTANDVQHRANILGADLGIPVEHDGSLYMLFGDTFGFAGIWPSSESHPDAVAYGLDTAAQIAAQPNLLCSRMRFATLAPANSLGPTINSSVIADFAGAAMSAPSGHQLSEYIRNPAGNRTNGPTFPYLPGDFEVPSGAFSYGDSIYVFYTTVVGPGNVDMKQSYLARWHTPTPGAAPGMEILYAVDERFDNMGPLHGHFVNISAQVVGNYVYLFGTGAYRASPIHLARKRLDMLATPGNFEELGEIISTAGYGETSVRYFPSLDRWVLLAQEQTGSSNRIMAWFADYPQGPWTSLVVNDWNTAFQNQYCCAASDNCVGDQMFDCTRTQFYGTYMLPGVSQSGSSFTITYTMSSFAPYNVALFQATFSP